MPGENWRADCWTGDGNTEREGKKRGRRIKEEEGKEEAEEAEEGDKEGGRRKRRRKKIQDTWDICNNI